MVSFKLPMMLANWLLPHPSKTLPHPATIAQHTAKRVVGTNFFQIIGFRTCLLIMAFLTMALAGLAMPASAQTVNDLANAVRQARQAAGMSGDLAGGGVGANDSAAPSAGGGVDSRPRQAVVAPAQPPSRLERDFDRRLRSAGPDAVGATLQMQPLQFGYDSVSGHEGGVPGPVAGAIDDNYIMGVGDEVVVTLRGQRNATMRARVNRDGQVVIPELRPITAAGRSFGDFRADLERAAGAAFLQTDVFVSIGAIRSIGVYVMGEVERPGIVRLTGLSTVLDALISAGGVRKTGSLRRIEVVRHGHSTTVDLYGLLLTGKLDHDMALGDGDKVVVPSVGPVVAVVGAVRRPGIYELPPGAAALPVAEALSMAGGPLRPDGYRVLRIAPDAQGRDQASEPQGRGASLRNGNILLLTNGDNSEIGGFLLDGQVAAPGVRSLQASPTIRGVLSDPAVFKGNPYLLFAALQTTDDRTQARYYVPVDLSRVMAGAQDVRLKRNDKLIVFGINDIRFLTSPDVEAVLSHNLPPTLLAYKEEDTEQMAAVSAAHGVAMPPKAPAGAAAGAGAGSGSGLLPYLLPGNRSTGADAGGGTDGNTAAAPGQAGAGVPQARNQSAIPQGHRVCESLKELATVVNSAQSERFSSAMEGAPPQAAAGGRAGDIPDLMACPQIFEKYPDLLPFALDYVVALQGEIQRPGAYPLLPGTPLSSVIAVAGGVGRDADMSEIELSRFQDERQKNGGSSRVIIDGRGGGLQQALLQPGDILRFNPVFTNRDAGPVMVRGEVKRPGLYNIYRGEKLSDLIARAGGLTDEAYPLGAVFTRTSVRQQEERARDEVMQAFDAGLRRAAVATAGTESTGGSSDTAKLVALAGTIRSAQLIGRVVVEADPVVLSVHPELDTVLEPGDALTVPKRPNHIAVAGEVLHPSALQFIAGRDPSDYIREAGGLSEQADSGHIYAILPNGVARPLSVSSWNFTPVRLPPGSTIVVPADLSPDGWLMTKDIAGVVGNIALSAASLVVISHY